MNNSVTLPEEPDAWCERVSALVDGELDDAELSALLDALDGAPEAAAAWGHYHVVGELLRGPATGGALRHDDRFVQGVCDRIAAEAQARRPAPAPTVQPVSPGVAGRASANDSVWRWKIVAGLSVLGMASVLGWHLVGARSTLSGPQLARVQAVPAAGGMVMIRDPQLDALIAAHQEQGGNSALQTPAGFVRNAAFERSAP